MKLSVIIPCRNCADTVGRQLEALSRQIWSDDWEVIVADNGSHDETRAVVESYGDRLPRLRIVDASDRPGAGHARNVAARHATGDAFLFCDADDEVAEGWLAEMGKALERHDFVASAHDLEKLNDDLTLATRRNNQKDGVQKYSYPPFLPHAATCGLGVKRETHELVGGFEERLLRLQDTDYCWRIQLAGTPLSFAPEAVVHYQLRSDALQTFQQAIRYGEYNVLLYKLYRPKGMPALPWKAQLRSWWILLRSMRSFRTPEQRVRLIRNVGWRLGRVKGSLKYRVLAL